MNHLKNQDVGAAYGVDAIHRTGAGSVRIIIRTTKIITSVTPISTVIPWRFVNADFTRQVYADGSVQSADLHELPRPSVRDAVKFLRPRFNPEEIYSRVNQ